MSNRAGLDELRANRAALVSALAEAGAELDGDTLRCPFHTDKHASGRIHQKDNVWRFYCMAGCDWNGGKKSGDVVDVLGKVRGLDYAGVLAAVGIVTDGNGNGRAAGGTAAPGDATAPGGTSGRGKRTKGTEGPLPADPYPAELAAKSAERLQRDPEALDELWNTRAVDAATAARFGVGIRGDRMHWTFPITSAGQVVAVKQHRIDPDGGERSKCYWTPGGVPSRHLYPVCLDGPGPVWLCPGELKALAVIAAGRPAVGITGGEGTELPDELADLLQGRSVAIVGDDDDVGRKWVRDAIDKLTAAGLDVRSVDLGLSKADGLKDVGDWILSRVTDGKEPDEIAAELDAAYQASDPWAKYTIGGVWADKATWGPVFHVPTGLTVLDTGLGGGLRVGGVHLVCGKSGRSKTTLVTQLALNAARAGAPVGFISLEMSRRDVGHLVAANLADVPRSWLDNGEVRGEPAERLRQAVERWGGLPLTVLDDSFWAGPLTRTKLAGIVGDGCRRFGWRLVAVDYLGLLAAEGVETEYHADLENSAHLKRLARVHGVALVVVAALRKYAKKDSDTGTGLDDVLGAGRLVYDSFSVLDVDCQQSGGDPGTRPTGLVRVRPLKTRFSGLASAGGELQFRWYPGIGRITDLETQRSFGAAELRQPGRPDMGMECAK